MPVDPNYSICLHLPPDIYEALEHFGKEEQVSVHHSAQALLMAGFDLWRKGQFDVPVTEQAQRYYGRSRAKKGQRHYTTKKHENKD
jgi:hypothetical protein